VERRHDHSPQAGLLRRGGAVVDHRGSCSSAEPPAPTETVRELSWSRIALPKSVAASSLAAASEALLVGGRASSGGDHPVLLVVKAAGSPRAVPLHPTSPYAKVADLVSVAAHGDEVVALGAAHGGAHANFRWTVWSGSRQRLDEDPQTFETFGGQSAGGLLDIVITLRGQHLRALGPPPKAGSMRRYGYSAAGSGSARNLLALRSPIPRSFRWHRAQLAPRARP
jgi:hypothetical protein